eukprot:Skav203788  [mRNA]  locus=scaffold206:499692:504209:+ [translate_table: standard]
MSYPECLQPMIAAHDVWASLGCEPYAAQRNAMLRVIEVHREQNTYVKCQMFSPEGFGFREYLQDHLSIPPDQPFDDNFWLLWKSEEAPPPADVKVWMLGLTEADFCPPQAHQATMGGVFSNASRWFPVPNSQSHSPVRMLELFAGAYAGWKIAMDHLSTCLNFDTQHVAIEWDENISKQYAINHHARWIARHCTLPSDAIQESSGNWILHKSVTDKDWIPAVAQWNPSLVVLSAPCPPWSGAANAPGLNCLAGQTFMHALLLCRWLRPQSILIEQVSAFAQHPHKRFVLAVLHWIGFRIVWQKQVELGDRMNVQRKRWLALAVRVNDGPANTQWLPWTPVPHSPSNAVMLLPPEIKEQLQLSEEVLQMARDPAYAKGVYSGLEGDNLLAARTFQGQGKISTFMACYGTQHQLPDVLLRDKGYLAHFVQDESVPAQARLWSPGEIMVLHGCLQRMYMSSQLREAWRVAGNLIAPLHAMLLLGNAIHRLMPERSVNLSQLMDTFQTQTFTMDQVVHTKCAEGYLIAPDSVLFTSTFKQNVARLLAEDDLPQWHPDDDPEEYAPNSAMPLASAITEEVPSTIDPTLEFFPGNLGVCHLDEHEERFWFSSNLTGDTLAIKWSMMMTADFQPPTDQYGVILTLGDQLYDRDSIQPNVTVLIRDDLHFLTCDYDTIIEEQPFLRDLAPMLVDQFGQEVVTHTPKPGMLLLSGPIEHERLQTHLPFVSAAAENCEVKFVWNHHNNGITVYITGDGVAVCTMKSLWAHVIHSGSLERLGRQVDIGETTIQYLPRRSTGVLPPHLMKEVLAIQACRMLMDAFSDPHGTWIHIRWLGDTIWKGTIARDTHASAIVMLLTIGMKPYFDELPPRLVHRGKMFHFDDALTACVPNSKGFVVLNMVQATAGGAPAKGQVKALHQSALASTLLEQGYDLDQVTQAVNLVMSKFSVHRIQSLTSTPLMKERLQGILTLCDEAGAKLIPPAKPATKADVQGLPWKPKRRKGFGWVDANEFTLVEGYFTNADGTDIQQLDSITPQASGISIMDSVTVEPYMQQSQLISSDELAVITIGTTKPPTTLVTQEITFPCRNRDNKLVLLHGFMTQFGAKAVLVKPETHTAIPTANCRLVAFTLHKDDWSPDAWMNIVHHTQATIRKMVGADIPATAIQALWGKSMRDGKKPASPAQATSVQMHCTIEAEHLSTVLKKSGYNKLYCTPKHENGRIDFSYRILWFTCDMPKLIAMSSRTQHALGLVRGKSQQNLGIRVHADHHAEVWALLCPGQDAPEPHSGDLVYKLEGLPFGTTNKMLAAWCKLQKWQASPLRSLGPASWLVRTADAPPQGLLTFNGHPLLVTHLPPRMPQERILVGPRSKPVSSSDPWQEKGGGDPWARFQGTTAMPQATPSRTVDGPIEARFKAQETQLNTLKAQVEQMATTQADHQKHVEQQFRAAEQREQQAAAHVDKSLHDLHTSIDKMISKNMAQQTQKMDAHLAELKHLFKSQKRNKPEAAASDMEDDES